jgi:hypothetical protein
MEQKELDESREAFISEVGNVGKKLALVLIATVVEVAKAEAQLAQSAALYAATHPTYVITNPIRTTTCDVNGHHFTCQTY